MFTEYETNQNDPTANDTIHHKSKEYGLHSTKDSSGVTIVPHLNQLDIS